MEKEELLGIIQQAWEEEWTELDLSGNEITELPPEIGKLIDLITLDLSINQLSTLPREIFQLSELQSLDIRFNQINHPNGMFLFFVKRTKT